MPKLDKQGRLTIPIELRNETSIPYNNNIAICYECGKIILLNCYQATDAKIIAFRKLDQKGRFFFPKEALSILDATKDSLFLVYLHHNKICIEAL